MTWAVAGNPRRRLTPATEAMKPSSILILAAAALAVLSSCTVKPTTVVTPSAGPEITTQRTTQTTDPWSGSTTTRKETQTTTPGY